MKRTKLEKCLAALALSLIMAIPVVHAEETLGDKAHEAAHDMKRSAKKAGRKADNAACEAGSGNCAGKKAKNKMKDAGDALEDAAD